MDQHPLKDLMDKLFPQKPDEKRAAWANTFIDEEYDHVDELKKMSKEEWEAVTKNLPMKIVSTLKKYLFQSQVPEKKKQSIEPEINIQA